MDYKLLSQIVTNIIQAIQNSAISAVKVLSKNKFDVAVTNLPKNQEIKGTVTVGNQKNLEKEVRNVDKSIKALKFLIESIKAPKSIEVSNFPKAEKYPDFPKEMTITNPVKELRVTNTKDFKNVTVDNQPTKEIKEVVSAVEQLQKVIKALKLDPKIKVDAPVVNVPETKIEFPTIPEPTSAEDIGEAIRSNDPKFYVPVRLTDGTEFYKALEEVVSAVSSGVIPFMGGDGKARRAKVDDLGRLVVAGASTSYYFMDSELVDTINYSGYQSSDGSWYIEKHTENSTTSQTRYASNSNNAMLYTDAWDDKENLTYATIQEANL